MASPIGGSIPTTCQWCSGSTSKGDAVEDLWPDDFGQSDLPPPVVILKEQAELLAAKTRGFVLARVSSTAGSSFKHTMYLTAPYLDGYTYQLLQAFHTIEMYPLTVASEGQGEEIQTPELLRDKLKRLFASGVTKRVISSMISMSRQIGKRPPSQGSGFVAEAEGQAESAFEKPAEDES
jgi:hypothetical protein